MKKVKIEELIGKTLVEIVGAEKGSKEIYFRCSDGSEYKLWHERDFWKPVTSFKFPHFKSGRKYLQRT